MRSFIPLVALAATAVSAIQFTSPTGNSTLTKGSEVQITWDSVDTDPSSMSLYLVNFVNWPPYYAPLESNVEVGSQQSTVRIPCDLANSYGYQINAINGTNVYIIYAQSENFSIGGESCTDPVDTSSTTCPPASTVTVTVSGTATLTGPVVVGTCPGVIGWKGAYDKPVALTIVPRIDRPLITAAPAPGQPWGDWTDNQADDVYITKTVTRVHTAYQDCPCEYYSCS